MRATIRDVARHPSWLGAWWGDLPARRRHWWWDLLRQPGSGWLRWEPVNEDRVHYSSFGYEPYDVWYAPPLRRLWMVVRGRDLSAWRWAKDPERMTGYR